MKNFVAYLLLAAAGLIYTTTSRAETAMQRGEYLVNSIVACGNCHTEQTPQGPNQSKKLAGTFLVEEPEFKAYAPNITPDKQSGIGHYDKADLIRAIREGKRPDGTIIGPPMPIGLYRGLSDQDVDAIATYILAQAPIANVVPKSTYRIPLPPSYGPPPGKVADVDRDDAVAYGRYLASSAGHCIECHTPMIKGQPDYDNQLGAGGFVFHGPWGASVSANLTSHPELGLARYTDEQVEKMIRTGIHASGRRMLPPMGYSYYRQISADDMKALIAYLRTLPPQATPK